VLLTKLLSVAYYIRQMAVTLR